MQLLTNSRSCLSCQVFLKIPLCVFVDLQKGLALGSRRWITWTTLEFWNRHAKTLCELTHRVLEADLFAELKEFEDITSDTASEAVKEAPIAIYVK